jgi:hypothetical protein
MKRFTVKDFIAYNNPCFSCGNKINFKIGFLTNEEDRNDPSLLSYLRPTVNNDYTQIDLVLTYSDSLKLYVFHRTNKIFTNSPKGLTNYLAEHKLFLQSTCDRCYTRIESHYLDFDLNKKFVKPTTISSERLLVSDSQNRYQINSFFTSGRSTLIIDKLDRTRPLSPTTLDLPLLPKYKFKDRWHFIEKIKTLVLFS